MSELNSFLRLRIKAIRKAYGLGQVEFLNALGVKMSRQNYSNMERGIINVNVKLADAVMKFSNIPLKEFLDTEKDLGKDLLLKLLEEDYQRKKEAILND